MASTHTCTTDYSALKLTQYDCIGDAFSITDGNINILKDCTVAIMSSAYLYEGYTAGDVVSAYVTVYGNGSVDLCRSTTRVNYANPYHLMHSHTVHRLAKGDVLKLLIKKSIECKRSCREWMDKYLFSCT